MITEHPTCLPEPAPRGLRKAMPIDPFSLLAHAYREAGVPAEVAWRCALADFQCIFPHLLRPGL